MNERQALGRRGEDLALAWYESEGYEVLERNWRCSSGEADLILARGSVLVVCEVKTRTTDRFGHPAEAVTTTRQRRLRRTAAEYLAVRDPGGSAAGRAGPGGAVGASGAVRRPRRTFSVRFDVACVMGADVAVIEDAF
jgi:putative endonuclease